MLKRLRWTLVMLGLVIAGASVYLALNPHWLKIESVQLELSTSSNEGLLFHRIQKTLGPQLQRYSGHFFWDVTLAQVYDLVSKDKRVRRASVYREFPSRLRVEIEPHTPVLAYLSSDNRVFPVATDATLLPPLALAELPDLPILRGEDLRIDQALREKAILLFEQVPNKGVFRKRNVSEISYAKKDGFEVYLGSVGANVKMGDADFGPKVSHVEKVLAYLDSQNIKGRVIDARFAKKVVVRVRNSP